jgi:uncharacterized protein (DUF1778 family)
MKGRKKSTEPIKNVGLYIKLTPLEKQLLKEAAAAANMSISAFVLSRTIK